MANEQLQWEYTPMGARVLVKDIITTVSLEERAKNAGISIVVNEINRPQSTQGTVVALGEDPFVAELYKIGDIVMFGRLAGERVYLADEEFRTLQLNEITGRLKRRVPPSSQLKPDSSTLSDQLTAPRPNPSDTSYSESSPAWPHASENLEQTKDHPHD